MCQRGAIFLVTKMWKVARKSRARDFVIVIELSLVRFWIFYVQNHTTFIHPLVCFDSGLHMQNFSTCIYTFLKYALCLKKVFIEIPPKWRNFVSIKIERILFCNFVPVKNRILFHLFLWGSLGHIFGRSAVTQDQK